MPRRIRDPQSRERIVEAAWRAIAEHGVRGATMRVIAGEAGVSTGFVTHYFDDKRQLADAVLVANNRRAGARVAEAQRGRRGLAALTAAVEALLPLDQARRREWQVWAAFWTATREGETRAGLLEGRHALRALLRASLREAVEDGDLPDALDLTYEAERLMTLAAGLGLLAGADPSSAERRAARRMLDDHLRDLATHASLEVR